MEDILNFKYTKGIKEIYPAHKMVKNWLFDEGEEKEATLANSLALIAEKNGMSQNDLMHLFPAILRMLKSDIKWTK